MKYIFLILLFTTARLAIAQYSGTPMMLSLPMDADTIQEDEPVFVWQTTLSNLQNDPRLNVQLSVVKMEKDQTAAEAIAENNPVFLRQNLLSSSLTYSSIDDELEEGVWYAWQIVLFYNGVQVQQSEVWKFIKAEPSTGVGAYIPMRKQLDNSIYELEGDLLQLCTNEPGTFQLSASIKGGKLKPTSIVLEEVLGEKVSENQESVHRTETRYYRCDLSELKLKKGIYRFEWIAMDGLNYVVFIEKN